MTDHAPPQPLTIKNPSLCDGTLFGECFVFAEWRGLFFIEMGSRSLSFKAQGFCALDLYGSPTGSLKEGVTASRDIWAMTADDLYSVGTCAGLRREDKGTKNVFLTWGFPQRGRTFVQGLNFAKHPNGHVALGIQGKGYLGNESSTP